MRFRIESLEPSPEAGEFAAEIREIFGEVATRVGPDGLATACSPPLDVYETDDALELAMDVPGIEASTLRILVKDAAVLIAGEKVPQRAAGRPSFHVVERAYGRFARTVRLAAAVDARRARATLANGELRLALPKLVNRRGLAIPVAVSIAQTEG